MPGKFESSNNPLIITMYLRSTLLSLALVIGGFLNAPAQTAPVTIDITPLRVQATKMGQALVAKDFKTFIKYTHPIVIKKMGGQAKMLKTLEEGVKNTALGGYIMVGFNVGNVLKVVRAGNELHALVVDNTVMDGELGTLSSTSYLLAISKDNGKNWLFVDASALTDQKAKALFPNYNPELKIPKKPEPVFKRKPKK